MKKTQVLYVHGGMTFRNREDYLEWLRGCGVSLEERKKWHDDYLRDELGDEFQVIKPRMPSADNAKYGDWKIWFEKYLDVLDEGAVLIGGSLGGIFLAKYLSENVLSRKVRSVYLIAPPFDNSVAGVDLDGRGFKLGEDLGMIMENCGRVVLMFSSDDDCVPVSHMEKYRKALPEAEVFVYDDKCGHFKVEEFSEIVEMIRGDVENFGKGNF